MFDLNECGSLTFFFHVLIFICLSVFTVFLSIFFRLWKLCSTSARSYPTRYVVRKETKYNFSFEHRTKFDFENWYLYVIFIN